MKKINFIAAFILAAASLVAVAQSNQTPVNITTVTPGGATAITSYGSMNTSYTFNLQNTTNSQFCQGSYLRSTNCFSWQVSLHSSKHTLGHIQT